MDKIYIRPEKGAEVEGRKERERGEEGRKGREKSEGRTRQAGRADEAGGTGRARQTGSDKAGPDKAGPYGTGRDDGADGRHFTLSSGRRGWVPRRRKALGVRPVSRRNCALRWATLE